MEIFDWTRVLMNDLPYVFLFEVILRVFIMLLLLLVFLRLTGKRGVRQLSIFEMVFIIALGSAVDDPMLYDNVGLLPGVTVLVVSIILYRMVTFISAKFKIVEYFLEGKTTCIIEDGEFIVARIKKENMARDEFFSELRLKSIEHLGQVSFAFLETTGDISIFMFSDGKVKYGLPILPQLHSKKSKIIKKITQHSCTFCGHTLSLPLGGNTCVRCGKDEWVESIITTRIT